MRKFLGLAGLVAVMGVVAAQAPGPKDGVNWQTDQNGRPYPQLVAISPPPWAIKGSGAVDLVKYKNGKITSTELTIWITSQKLVDGSPAWSVEAKGKVAADGLSFTIESPSGGIPENTANVKVSGKFKENPADANSRDFELSGIAQ